MKNIKILSLITTLTIITSSSFAKNYNDIKGENLKGFGDTTSLNNKNYLIDYSNKEFLREVPKGVKDYISKEIEIAIENRFEKRYNKRMEQMRLTLQQDLLKDFQVKAYKEESRKVLMAELEKKEKEIQREKEKLEQQQKEYEEKRKIIENNIIQQKVSELTEVALEEYLKDYAKNLGVNKVNYNNNRKINPELRVEESMESIQKKLQNNVSNEDLKTIFSQEKIQINNID